MTAQPPPGPPPLPQYLPAYPPPRDRSVSFFVALFLGLLLLLSGALNVVLFVFSIGGLASGLGGSPADDSGYEMVSVSGDAKARSKVLRVPVRGVIAEEASPILGAQGGTVSQVTRALKAAARDDSIRGILLDIDSPGGGVTASDQIYRLLKTFRAEHPGVRVLALFGDVAASGGYYIAAAAEHIVARRTSITGSIGVIMNSYNFAEAAKKVGVEDVVIKSEHTPFKDILSPMRPMTGPEREILTSIVEEMYQQFVTVVDEGRPKLDRAQVQALADGRVYSAGQALQNGLVDELGDQAEALAWFEQQLGRGAVELLEYKRRPSLADVLLGRTEAKTSAADLAAKLLGAPTGPRLLYYWTGAR
jgi:protease-4